jgi:hypothetical protein
MLLYQVTYYLWPRVGHEECSVGVAGHGVMFVCLRVLEEGQDCFWEINSLDTLAVLQGAQNRVR